MMRDDDGLRLPNLGGGQPDVHRQVYVWREPELRLAVRVCYVDVDAGLFAGEEEQSELSVADDSRCHAETVAEEPRRAWLLTPNVRAKLPAEAGAVSPGCDDAPCAAARAYSACRSGSA